MGQKVKGFLPRQEYDMPTLLEKQIGYFILLGRGGEKPLGRIPKKAGEKSYFKNSAQGGVCTSWPEKDTLNREKKIAWASGGERP